MGLGIAIFVWRRSAAKWGIAIGGGLFSVLCTAFRLLVLPPWRLVVLHAL